HFIDNSFAARVFAQSGQSFIHWTLEPKKINFVGRGDRYQAVFELVLRIEDNEGKPVLEQTEEIPLSVTPEQYKAHERQLFAFQDIVPIIPGRFKLFGLLKNKSARDFTSFSAPLAVSPEGEDRPMPLLLYHSREKMSGPQARGLKAFAFGEFHYLVNARNEFLPQSEIGAYLRLPASTRASLAAAREVLFEVRPVEATEAVFSQEKRLGEVLTADGEGLDTGVFSLAQLKPGYYSAALSLLDDRGQGLFSAGENFILLSQNVPVLPWVYAKSHPAFPSHQHLFLLSTEHFLTGRYVQAAALAEQALDLKDDPPTRVLLGKILFALGRYKDSLDVLKPTEQKGFSREAAKVMAADLAGLKDWPSALVYLEKLLAEATEVSVLNLAGECYLNLNQPERALPLLQKSLAIDPNQPGIKALLDKAQAALREAGA
ncbi:MAG: CDC27 family protein, partial [Acidobacteriota bacterium]